MFYLLLLPFHSNFALKMVNIYIIGLNGLYILDNTGNVSCFSKNNRAYDRTNQLLERDSLRKIDHTIYGDIF